MQERRGSHSLHCSLHVGVGADGSLRGFMHYGVATASCERDGSLHCGKPIEVTARIPADVLSQRQRLFYPSPATVDHTHRMGTGLAAPLVPAMIRSGRCIRYNMCRCK